MLDQVCPSTHDVDHGTVLSSVGLDVAATPKPPPDQLENLAPVAVLADMELRNQLKAGTAGGVTVDGDCKAALTIHIARDVTIQPFLLIVRTRHIFTLQTESVRTALYE